MAKRQRSNEFGLNLQHGKNGGAEIETKFDVIIFVEPAVNRLGRGRFAAGRDNELRGNHRFELRSAANKLRLRHNPVVIFVQIGELRGILDRQRQYRLQAAQPWADRDAAQPRIVSQSRYGQRDRADENRKKLPTTGPHSVAMHRQLRLMRRLTMQGLRRTYSGGNP